MNISDRHPVEKHTRQSAKYGIHTKTPQMNIHNQLIIQDPQIPATNKPFIHEAIAYVPGVDSKMESIPGDDVFDCVDGGRSREIDDVTVVTV